MSVNRIFFIACTSLLVSCSNSLKEGAVIVTQLIHGPSPDHKSEDRYQIAAYDPSKPSRIKVLTSGFWSACSPDVACNGTSMVFSAKANQNDHWQIWELKLKNLELRKITAIDDDCKSPVWLPDGNIAFTRQSGSGSSLFRCDRDGINPEQITFDPYSYTTLSVLSDGRLLSLRKEKEAAGIYAVLRPDGTKNSLFYRTSPGSVIRGTARERNGSLVFIETEEGTGHGKIISISYNMPLQSRAVLSGSIDGDINSAFPLDDGDLLVSFRPASDALYGLYRLGRNGITFESFLADSTADIIEAIILEKREMPKKLPSEVDKGVATGLLLCQNISFNGLPGSGKINGPSGIDVIGQDSLLGELQSEKDGSIYLKVIADKPFRLQVKGNGPDTMRSAWIYLRPNERRGCVGCHESPETVPDNRLALAVGKPPVSIPMHVMRLKEKEIDLE